MTLLVCKGLKIVVNRAQFQARERAQVQANWEAVTTEVQLGCRTPMFADTGEAGNPFATLALALSQYSHAPQFRVTWSDNLGSGWDRGTMLYDRKRGTLKYYDIGGAGEAGEEFYCKSDVFTGLSDRSLLALVQKFDNLAHIHELLPFAFLFTLPKLGYRRTKLDDYKRGTPY